MRLTSVTTIKSKHLFPSSKMSLLKNSHEKLNDIIADDCKDLPGLLTSKAHVLAKQWYIQTKDHRRRLGHHLRKNWLRLLLSAVVLMAQFVWFTSYFVESKLVNERNTACHQQLQQERQAVADHFVSITRSDNYEESMSSSLGKLILEYNSSPDSNGSDDDPAMIAGYDAQFSLPFLSTTTTNPLPDESRHNSQTSSLSGWLSTLLLKALMLCKLALIMLFFELLRLTDTVVNVIRQIHDEEDEKHRTPPKSPVDTGYIERNRGYK